MGVCGFSPVSPGVEGEEWLAGDDIASVISLESLL